MGKRRTENANQPMSPTDLEFDFFIDDIATPFGLLEDRDLDPDLIESAR